MLKNTAKDDVRAALERAGYSTCTHNIELVYQAKQRNTNYSAVIKEVKAGLRKY